MRLDKRESVGLNKVLAGVQLVRTGSAVVREAVKQ